MCLSVSHLACMQMFVLYYVSVVSVCLAAELAILPVVVLKVLMTLVVKELCRRWSADGRRATVLLAAKDVAGEGVGPCRLASPRRWRGRRPVAADSVDRTAVLLTLPINQSLNRLNAGSMETISFEPTDMWE